MKVFNSWCGMAGSVLSIAQAGGDGLHPTLDHLLFGRPQHIGQASARWPKSTWPGYGCMKKRTPSVCSVDCVKALAYVVRFRLIDRHSAAVHGRPIIRLQDHNSGSGEACLIRVDSHCCLSLHGTGALRRAGSSQVHMQLGRCLWRFREGRQGFAVTQRRNGSLVHMPVGYWPAFELADVERVSG
jgi:hypothetical protein